MKLDPNQWFKISIDDLNSLLWFHQVSTVTFCVWGKNTSHPPVLFVLWLLTVVEEKVHIEAKSRNTSYYCRKFGCDGRGRN